MTGPKPGAGHLSAREDQIARLAAKGHNTNDISVLAHLSTSAVNSTMSRIYEKLNITSRAELVALHLAGEFDDHPAVPPDPRDMSRYDRIVAAREHRRAEIAALVAENWQQRRHLWWAT
jgi:DNA-binding CsgD family transcriptional regulator